MTMKPNIILILNDDMGYSDLGCYGGEVHSPHLDSLAAGGLRYTQFYNTARCCPSRASLLTGLYPHQADIGHMMGDDGIDGYLGDLNRNTVTIAEALKLGGYRTYMSGKWKLVCKYPGKWELYDMKSGRTELNDVSDDHPVKVRELAGLYSKWAEKCNILSWEDLIKIKKGRGAATEKSSEADNGHLDPFTDNHAHL